MAVENLEAVGKVHDGWTGFAHGGLAYMPLSSLTAVISSSEGQVTGSR